MFLKPCLEIIHLHKKKKNDILTFYNLSVTESWGI